MNNILKRTRQSWKLTVFFIGLLLSGILMLLGFFNIDNLDSSRFFMFVGGGMLIGVTVFVWSCLIIQCPNCKTKWLWYFMSKKSALHGSWFVSLTTLDECPVCKKDYR
ncbi:MAG: hypothetical protein KZQ89_16375 [Candidatus Thiodiazotropha sp. (ex Lucinoma kastoroae)]|nr:hypothetical protein [Candidatus Thiodiazotropha sp. (ex Lucinoma kastoroae)]